MNQLLAEWVIGFSVGCALELQAMNDKLANRGPFEPQFVEQERPEASIPDCITRALLERMSGSTMIARHKLRGQVITCRGQTGCARWARWTGREPQADATMAAGLQPEQVADG